MYETYNAGGVTKLEALNGGMWTMFWQTTEAIFYTSQSRIFSPPFTVNVDFVHVTYIEIV